MSNSEMSKEQSASQDLELKYLLKLDKQKTAHTQEIKALQEAATKEKNSLLKDNLDLKDKVKLLEQEVQKALKIHKANQALQQKLEQVKNDSTNFSGQTQELKTTVE